jgi:glycosyltransferase involved in cell wall biosynthesis
MALDPLKVLVFTSLYPNEVDPVFGVFVENRLRHFLADTPHEAVVVAPVPWFPFKSKRWGRYGKFARVPRVEVRHGITVYHPRYLVIPKLGMWLTPWTLYCSALGLIRRLQREQGSFDLIDAHYLYPDGVAAAKLSTKLGLPFVMTARGSDVTEIAQQKVAGAMVLEAAQKAAHVITVSNSLRRDLITLGVEPSHVSTLRNGVDAEHFKPDEAEKPYMAFDGARHVVAFAGWLIERKRVDIAIAALPHLEGGVHLAIAGEGPLRAALVAQAESLGVADRVHFLGKVPPSEMPAFFSAADVLVLPSEREGWANVLLEAMACGTPVVSRAVAGALDLVTCAEAGNLVDGSDPSAYAHAIRDVLERRISRETTRAYAKTFGWREISLSQEGIFTRAAGLGAEKLP